MNEKLIKELSSILEVGAEGGTIKPDWEKIKEVHDSICNYYGLLDFDDKREMKLRDVENASRPLIKYLNDNYHPHVTAIVTTVSVEILEGVASVPKIYDFIKD